MLASGQTISVNDIGFTGNFNPTFGGAGGGSATGLTDDGALVFPVGTHILTTGANLRLDFV